MTPAATEMPFAQTIFPMLSKFIRPNIKMFNTKRRIYTRNLRQESSGYASPLFLTDCVTKGRKLFSDTKVCENIP